MHFEHEVAPWQRISKYQVYAHPSCERMYPFEYVNGGMRLSAFQCFGDVTDTESLHTHCTINLTKWQVVVTLRDVKNNQEKHKLEVEGQGKI